MLRKNILPALTLVLGFAIFNTSYADEIVVFEKAEASASVFADEVPLGNIGNSELEILLALNEEQSLIEELQAQNNKDVQKEESLVSFDSNQKLIDVAKSKLGSPYSYSSRGPNAFDCSGFTSYVYGQIGINLPRTAASQAYGGMKVSKSDLQKGDLVFFDTFGGISHVGIYMENGNFIHASSYGRGVVINNINDSYYAPRYITAARYL